MDDLLNTFNAFECCPACGGTLYDRGLRYCETPHTRGVSHKGSGRFLNAGDQSLASFAEPRPHLHATCPCCSYEWLERLKTE